MTDEYLRGLLGGILIGFASLILLLFNGRVLGVSGIVSGILESPIGERGWRIAFALGVFIGGFIMVRQNPEMFAVSTGLPWIIYPIAGFIVGIGTRLGNGCTSGHGVCGIGRGSLRSITATLVFITTAAITVGISRLVQQG